MGIRYLIVLASLVAAAVAVTHADRYEEPHSRVAFTQFPVQVADWKGSANPPFTPRVLEVLGVDDYLSRTYRAPGRQLVDLYIGYWASQRQGDSIHSPLNCLPGAGWEPVSDSRIEVPGAHSPAGGPVLVNRYVVQKGLDRNLVLYWYQSHGRIVASEYWGKIYTVTDAVRLNRTDAAIVRIVAPISEQGAAAEAAAEKTALAFARAVLPQLDGYLPL
jgi:EpsI family protein